MKNQAEKDKQRKVWEDWFLNNTCDLMVQRELVDRAGKMVTKAAKKAGYQLLFKRAHYYFRKEV